MGRSVGRVVDLTPLGPMGSSGAACAVLSFPPLDLGRHRSWAEGQRSRSLAASRADAPSSAEPAAEGDWEALT